jgi:hypothetical protein
MGAFWTNYDQLSKPHGTLTALPCKFAAKARDATTQHNFSKSSLIDLYKEPFFNVLGSQGTVFFSFLLNLICNFELSHTIYSI